VPLLILVGIPGSGKSTWARRVIQDHPDYHLVSTDAIRLSLYGDAAIQGDWMVVWAEVVRQWQEGIQAIRAGTMAAVIYDATNARRRYRREVVATAQSLGFNPITLCWLDVPLRVALQRNRGRRRQVPGPVIASLYRQLRGAPPALAEGVDQVVRIVEPPAMVCR
jgi:predicted kinase